MTWSGQVRSGSEIGSTSSAKLRYRLTGMDEARWVFQDGWPGLGWPAGVRMARTEENESADSEMVVMLWLRMV